MPKKSMNLQWTKKQFDIANLYNTGTSEHEAAQQVGCAQSLVHKVWDALKNGQKSPTLEEMAAKTKATTPSSTDGGDGSKPASQKQVIDASVIKFVPQVVTCPLTPIMQIGKIAAQQQWGWNEKMPWEDFIDTVIYHYFEACGIILQGYVVEEGFKANTVEQQEEVAVHGS